LGEAEKREKGLNGYAIEATGYVQGLETTFIFVTVPGVSAEIEKIGGVSPIHLNEKVANPTASDRLAEAVRLGDYLGYLEDAGLGEDQYPFTTYIQDLKDGKDRTYKILCSNRGLYGEFTVDPMKTHQMVWTLEKVDLYGNGDAEVDFDMNNHAGYVPLPDGGIRIIGTIPRDYFYLRGGTWQHHRWYIGATSGALMEVMLFVLGLAEEDQTVLSSRQARAAIKDLSQSKARQRINDLMFSDLPGDDTLNEGTLFTIQK
jgi:hypothetical protein